MKKRPKNSSTTTTPTRWPPSVYECADFFLARFANLPLSLLDEIKTEEQLLAFYQNCPLLQNAIADASPSLHEALKKGKGLDGLRKYFTRMCTRTTPFGLFTSVAWGEFKEQSFSLSKEIQKQVEEAADQLWHSAQPKRRISKTLHRYFLEKYGLYRFVPLTELLDNSMAHTILHSKGEELSVAEPPPSMELYFQLSSDGELILSGLSTQALSTFGRFNHLWDQPKIETMKDFLKKEEALYPHILFVETSFEPEKAPSLGYYTPLRKVQFNDIETEEILIGAHADHLYAYSNKRNQELSFVPATAVNLDLAPLALKLLFTISRSRFGNIDYSPHKLCIEKIHSNHAVEFVIPLVRKTPAPVKQVHYPPTKQYPIQERIGTDWFYAKLYLPQECADDFLKELNFSAKWFYIRYKDSRFHIRLRIHSSSQLSWINSLLLEKQIEDYSICPYERELERYDHIEAAEEIFCQDSLACIHLLKHMKELNLPLPILGAYGILHYLRFYTGPPANFFNHDKIKGIRGLKYESNAILETAYAHIDFGDYKPSFTAMDSLIHMHCNRLGLNPKMEMRARAIAHYLFQRNNQNGGYCSTFLTKIPCI